MTLLLHLINLVAILTHAFYVLRNPSWKELQFDRHGVYGLIGLTALAVANACTTATVSPNANQDRSVALSVLFGVGEHEGFMQLGLAGLYWGIVISLSVIKMFATARRPSISRTCRTASLRALVPIALGVGGIMAAIGLLVWGLRY